MKIVKLCFMLFCIAFYKRQALAQACAPTPRDAAARMHLTLMGIVGEKKSTTGYRIRNVHWDATLGSVWASLEDCAHPERPWAALRIKSATVRTTTQGVQENRIAGKIIPSTHIMPYTSPQPVVHAGDLVQLWQSGEWVRMELAAVAEQSGSTGENIWLRVKIAGNFQQMHGVVRGPGSVEMLP